MKIYIVNDGASPEGVSVLLSDGVINQHAIVAPEHQTELELTRDSIVVIRCESCTTPNRDGPPGVTA